MVLGFASTCLALRSLAEPSFPAWGPDLTQMISLIMQMFSFRPTLSPNGPPWSLRVTLTPGFGSENEHHNPCLTVSLQRSCEIAQGQHVTGATPGIQQMLKQWPFLMPFSFASGLVGPGLGMGCFWTYIRGSVLERTS